MKRESLTEMLTEIIDSMHDGFFVVARSGEIIMANSALLEMTGYSHDEVVGRTCTILQCDECRQHRVHCGEHWCQLFARGETIRQLCNIMTKDGHVLHVLKSSQVVRDESGEIIASVEKGLYAPNFGGGQVDITSGKFVFSASEAYLIENGKVTVPVKGAMLIGDGPDALHRISMVGNDLELDTGVGTCGKEGQSVPVGVGQPTLKIDELTVGGTA